jgi:DNA helicase HerA-like ATPase
VAPLFDQLPEVGDPEKPKLVFFFDEAHLLFSDLPKIIEDKVVQVVRLIRSKGVGVYFVTQNPLDVPQTVLGQLGNRVQHALRAFTPQDQKAVKTAAETFRTNPKLDVGKAITELAVGEALVSFLDANGTPGMVERAMVCPPHSQIGPITPEQRQALIKNSVVAGVYENAVDRESAFEVLRARAGQSLPTTATGPGQVPASPPWYENIPGMSGHGRRGDNLADAMAKSAARAMGSSLGRQIIRGVLGSLLGGKKR